MTPEFTWCPWCHVKPSKSSAGWMCSMRRMQAQRCEWFSRWSSNCSTSCQDTGCMATTHGSNLSLEVRWSNTRVVRLFFGDWCVIFGSGFDEPVEMLGRLHRWSLPRSWLSDGDAQNAQRKLSMLLRNSVSSYLQFYNKCKRHLFFFLLTTHFGFGCKWGKKSNKIHLNLSFNVKISHLLSWEKLMCPQHDKGKGVCWWEAANLAVPRQHEDSSSGLDAPPGPVSPFQHPPPVTLGPYSAFAGRILKEMAHFWCSLLAQHNLSCKRLLWSRRKKKPDDKGIWQICKGITESVPFHG